MTALAHPSRPSPFAVFRNRSFTLLWIARFVSTLGSGLTTVAASIVVYRATGSALSVGLMLLMTALPTLLLGLVAGVVVDRYDRKRIMIVAEAIRATLIVLIPILLPFGIAWLYVLALLSSAAAQFFEPAQESLLPETATDEELAAASSMMELSFTAAMSIGFALGGLLAAVAVEWAFYLDGLSFVIGAICIALVRVPPRPAEAEETSAGAVLTNLREGLEVIRTTPALRSLMLLYVPVGLVFGLENALFLPFATRALGATEVEYGMFEAALTIGFVAGSFLMAHLADKLHPGQWITISVVGMGLGLLAIASADTVLVALAISVGYSLLNAPSVIGRKLIIARAAPRESRGRVVSAFFVTRDTMFVLGMAAAGLADLLDVRLLMLACAVALLACAAVSLLLPGLGQPTAEWRQILAMLRAAPSAPELGLGRAATAGDLNLLAALTPELGALSVAERQRLAGQMRVHRVEEGTAVVREGAPSDSAYFILSGRAAAGRAQVASQLFNLLSEGDFFGEIGALTGAPRTADVVAVLPTTLLQVPAATLRQLMAVPQIRSLVLAHMAARMANIETVELPSRTTLDQQALRDLRQASPYATTIFNTQVV